MPSWSPPCAACSKTINVVSDTNLTPQSDAQLIITRADGSRSAHTVLLHIDTPVEVDYYRAGGILPFVLRQLLRG
jgi:aconitate hydratase